MRNILLVLAVLITAAPATAADEYWSGDNLLACLIGKGAVEMRHGATAEAAILSVRNACVEAFAEPEPAPDEEPEGEWGDYLDYAVDAAQTALEAVADAGVVF